MKKFFGSVTLAFAFFTAFCQDPILISINDSIKVTKSEFERTFKKNNGPGITGEQKNIDDYLQLFTNFKLKVIEAEKLKLDTNKKFKKEYDGYVKQLSEPFLVDTNVDSKILQEAYERMKWSVRTSHILISIGLDATPKDTLIAYQQALAIRKRIIAGENFDTLARKLSKDPSAKQNSGDIGYMDVFSTVYEYENAMYTLKLGEISMPIRSKFGYHIIKVTDKKPAKGEIKMAHIIVLPKKQDSTFNAKARIDSAFTKLKSGVDFAKVVSEYSDDKRTSNNGGIFPSWINTTQRFPQKFIDVAYNLEIGKYSEPFETEFGWHIIKIIDKRVVMPYSEAIKVLKSQIARDQSRNNAGKHSVYLRLKKEYNLTVNQKNFKAFITKVDTSILSGNWKLPKTISETTILATFANEKITEKAFATWILGFEKKSKVDASIGFVVNYLWDIYTEGTIMNYEKKNLTKKYPDLANLLKEYHDGMLLFDLIDKTIWSKSNSDSAGVEAFYEKNKTNYMWGQRVEVNRFTCKNETVLESVKKALTPNPKNKLTETQIVALINKKDAGNVSFESKKYSKGEDQNVDKLDTKPNSIAVLKDNVIIEFKSIVQSEPKQLSECRGMVISDYQKQLEEQWIRSLQEKNKVVVNQDVLKTIKETLK
jgi:peptidyl-prolyl cis-trans isomerase SurA